jgi:hypothetical protein
MRLPSSARAASALAALVALALTIIGSPLIEPAAAVNNAPASDAQLADDLQKPGSVSAMATARASGHRVEDLSQTTETERVFANPDGTWTADTAPAPVRVRDGRGAWHDIDTTLVARDGGLAPKYAASDVVLSDGGDKALVSMTENGKDISWKWPKVLPKPVVAGNTATYPDVVPDGDLVVTAQPTGFSHSIVLRSAPSDPLKITMPIATDGTDVNEARDGDLTVDMSNGKALISAPQPQMWDATADQVLGVEADDEAAGTSAPGSAADLLTATAPAEDSVPVDATVEQSSSTSASLTLSPNQSYLTDPDTVYPVVIDPTWTSNTTGDTYVMNYDPTATAWTDENLRVGSGDGGGHVRRAFLHFRSTDWSGKHVLSAKLILHNWNSSTCHGANITVSRITQDWYNNEISWNDQPPVATDYDKNFYPAYGITGCPTADASWDVTGLVQGWASGKFGAYGVRLKAQSESNSDSYRGYASGNSNDVSDHPYIEWTYNAPPEVATSLTATPGGEGYTTSATPTLSARVTDSDPRGELTARFDVLDGSDVVWSGQSEPVPSGSIASASVPAETLDIGKTYTVRVKADDGLDQSAAYASASLAIDAAAAVTPAQQCTSPCTEVSPQPLIDTTTTSKLQPGESRTFSANLSSLSDQVDIDKEAVSVAVLNLTSSGSVTLFDPDYARPKAPTLDFSGDGQAEAQTTAEVMPSGDGQLAIRNNGESAIDVMVVVTGWYPWIDTEEGDLDAAEETETPDTDQVGADVSDVTDPVMDTGDDPSINERQALGDPAESSDGTSEACVDNNDGTETCLTEENDDEYRQDYALDEQSGYQTSADGNAALRAAPDPCSVDAIGYKKAWTLLSRFNACRNARWTATVRRVRDLQVIGRARYVQEERLDLDPRTTDIQHRWRFVYLGGYGAATYINITSQLTCMAGCIGNDISQEFDSIDATLFPTTVWHHKTHQGTPTGFGVVEARTVLHGSLSGSTGKKVGFSDPAPHTRCDNVIYVTGSGCVFERDIPRFKLYRAPTGRAPQSAQHIWDAQHKPPHWGAQLLGGDPLQRAYGGGIKTKNRREARRQCRLKGVTKSCDEWPFASTYQGCYVLRADCHVRGIDLADNKLSGSFLGAFYSHNRVLDRDKFWVKIY